jgi:hypothetical protein
MYMPPLLSLQIAWPAEDAEKEKRTKRDNTSILPVYYRAMVFGLSVL